MWTAGALAWDEMAPASRITVQCNWKSNVSKKKFLETFSIFGLCVLLFMHPRSIDHLFNAACMVQEDSRYIRYEQKKVQSFPCLSELRLEKNILGDGWVERFVSSAHSRAPLEVLDLKRTEIGDASIIEIASALRMGSLGGKLRAAFWGGP